MYIPYVYHVKIIPLEATYPYFYLTKKGKVKVFTLKNMQINYNNNIGKLNS